MRKKNGFVFMETVVVVGVLSITLLMLFGSYSFLLRNRVERNTYDTTEMIYKTYYVKEIIDSYKPTGNNSIGIEYFIDSHRVSVHKWEAINSYVCDLSSNLLIYYRLKWLLKSRKSII